MKFKEPLWMAEPTWEYTYGPQVVSLCRQVGYIPDPEQERILDAIFAVGESGLSAAYETAVIAPRQNLKALAVDTPLLTTTGWKTMGTVQVGEKVMSPSGFPTTVIGKSDVKTGHTVYRVTLTDGRSLLADAGHLWTVYDRTREKEVTETTEQLLARGVTGARPKDFKFRLPRQYGLQLPEQALEIDPYVLGAWLGGGFSRSGHICTGAEDVGHLRGQVTQAGHGCTESMSRAVHVLCVDGLTAKLRAAGLLGNRHVPERYLRGSAEQRLALLQGLLDTDGTVSAAGQVSFVSTKESLAEAVVFLVRSLGWRASIIERRARLNGQDKGPVWWVQFSPSVGEPVPFRMPRKAAKIKAGLPDSRFSVSIRDISEVESVPVQCIKVAAPDGLFLAGRDLVPTHNTGLGKMAALGWMFVTEEEVVTWSAHLFPTAMETFKDLSSLILNSPLLLKRMAAGTTHGIHGARGSESFETRDGREMRFRARTKTGARGLTGDKLILDEAFALEEEHMGSVLPTLTAVPDPQILYLSSAGMLRSAILRDTRDRGRRKDAGLAYYEWASEHRQCLTWSAAKGQMVENLSCDHPKPGTAHWKPGCALDDEELWAQGNPLLGRTRANGTGLTLEKMRSFRRSEPPLEWMRERMGWWEDPDQASVFGAGFWNDCKGDKPEGAPLMTLGVAVSFDLARSSIVGATGTKERPVVQVLQNGPGQDWIIPRLAQLKRDHPHANIVLDPKGPAGSLFRDIRLYDARYDTDPLNVTEITLEGALDACSDIFKAVTERRLTHLNEAELNLAVEDAVKRDVRDRWMWGRKQSSSDISPLEAATWAVWALSEQPFESAYERAGVATV